MILLPPFIFTKIPLLDFSNIACSFLQPRLSVEWDAFEASSESRVETRSTSWNRTPLRGSVTIMNTVETFKVTIIITVTITSTVTIMNTVETTLNVAPITSYDSYFFQAVDKAAFLQKEGERLWSSISQGSWQKDPDTLAW